MFWGGSITKSITIKSTKLPQTKIMTIQNNDLVFENLYKIHKLFTKIHQIDTNVQDIQ